MATGSTFPYGSTKNPAKPAGKARKTAKAAKEPATASTESSPETEAVVATSTNEETTGTE